jgi:hypothetical protein
MYSQHSATIRSSEQYNAYYEQFTDNVIGGFSDSGMVQPKVLEIGCNDGLLLWILGRKFQSRLIGVEPSDQFHDVWADRFIDGVNSFFGAALALEMSKKYGHVDVIIARHVLEHIANPHDFFKGLEILSSESTVLYVEVPYLLSILTDFRYENVSYSHLVHYSVTSMHELCRLYGFAIRDYELVDVDGGSIVFEIRRFGASDDGGAGIPDSEKSIGVLFERYFDSFTSRREEFGRILSSFDGREIVGFGAGAKGQFLVHIYGLDRYLDKIFDETPGHAGQYVPGTDLQICKPSFDDCVDGTVFVNLAPTHARHIRAKVPSRFLMLDPVNDRAEGPQ